MLRIRSLVRWGGGLSRGPKTPSNDSHPTRPIDHYEGLRMWWCQGSSGTILMMLRCLQGYTRMLNWIRLEDKRDMSLSPCIIYSPLEGLFAYLQKAELDTSIVSDPHTSNHLFGLYSIKSRVIHKCCHSPFQKEPYASLVWFLFSFLPFGLAVLLL